jgi:hypothetical protein
MPAPKGTLPPNAGKGRRAGVPNKVTQDVRTALAAFAKGNVEKLQAWLDAVARRTRAKRLTYSSECWSTTSPSWRVPSSQALTAKAGSICASRSWTRPESVIEA